MPKHQVHLFRFKPKCYRISTANKKLSGLRSRFIDKVKTAIAASDEMNYLN